MCDLDERLWEVPEGRVGDLRGIDTLVQNNCVSSEQAIVYYPGSGNDILHPLFASCSRARYFVFVDINPELAQQIEGDLAELAEKPNSKFKHASLPVLEFSKAKSALKIKTDGVGWQFECRGQTRTVLLFICKSEDFLVANPSFEFDVFFEKDFWETAAQNELAMTLSRLRTHGMLISDSFSEAKSYFSGLIGLEKMSMHPFQLNSAMYVFKKTRGTSDYMITKLDGTLQAAEKAAVAIFQFEGFSFISDTGQLKITEDEHKHIFGTAIEKSMKVVESAGFHGPLLDVAYTQVAQKFRGTSPSILNGARSLVTNHQVSEEVVEGVRRRAKVLLAQPKQKETVLKMAIGEFEKTILIHGRPMDKMLFGRNMINQIALIKTPNAQYKIESIDRQAGTVSLKVITT